MQIRLSVTELVSERIDQSAGLIEGVNLIRDSDWSVPGKEFLPHTLLDVVWSSAQEKGGSPM